MNNMANKKCTPCEGGVAPLNSEQAKELQQQTPLWTISSDNNSITRTFTFKNFLRVMSFVNACAHVANQQDHHPDFKVSYNQTTLTYSTHAINGLSDNDFICAAKIDLLYE